MQQIRKWIELDQQARLLDYEKLKIEVELGDQFGKEEPVYLLVQNRWIIRIPPVEGTERISLIKPILSEEETPLGVSEKLIRAQERAKLLCELVQDLDLEDPLGSLLDLKRDAISALKRLQQQEAV